MERRKPAVAGMFYAGEAKQLEEQIRWCYQHKIGPGVLPQVNQEGPRRIAALVVPHAGYMYSGPVAAHAYGELARDGVFDTAVIIGPNHTGYGPPVSLGTDKEWHTPLGEVEVNWEMTQKLAGGVMQIDESAHMYEHSVEVQLPWLQHLYPRVKIVPITMLAQDMNTAYEVGRAIAKVADNTIIIASSDFTHYEPYSVAKEKDFSMIAAIIGLDEKDLYRKRNLLQCSMCGYGPVAAAIVAAREKKATEAKLLKYATSGDSTGDFSSVVGYASLVMKL